jgi:3-oxoacyl-[acyl-carrier protein] reductase
MSPNAGASAVGSAVRARGSSRDRADQRAPTGPRRSPDPAATTHVRPCLIVGATGEIGAAVARRLLVEGYPLALTHAPTAAPKAGLGNGRTPGYIVQWYAHDVRDSSQARTLVDQVDRDLVGVPDLVYCAGALRDKPIALMSDNDWHEVLATNLSGVFYLARELASKYTRVHGARVVLIGAQAATKGAPLQANYAAAKGGIEALARQLATEIGVLGATCNVVVPGVLDGRMADRLSHKAQDAVLRQTPLGHFGRASDVAGVVAWLMSEQGRYVTGQTIRVDGGLSAT